LRRIFPYCIGLLLWLPGKLNAQRVIYSESFNTRNTARVQVIGKSENYYWVEKLQRQKSGRQRSSEGLYELRSFELFDFKLNLVKEIPATYIAGTLKQWLLAGKKGMDQVMLLSSSGKTTIYCRRFWLRDTLENQTMLVGSLPFSTGASRFLLVRSEDQSKILLLAFENTDSESSRLYATLYDSDWNLIYQQEISHTQFSQPCIQDEEVGFPAESFDNMPIKLANNGEWLMASPSTVSRNFSLFHVCPNGSDFYFREIPLSPFYKIDDIAMSINNDLQEMSVGLLSSYSNTTLKNVQVYNYSMKQGIFYFDSSYHFNTQAHDIQNKNLTHESFISVPDGGYMFLKEYGPPFEFDKPKVPFITTWEAAYLMADYSEPAPDNKESKQGYSLNRGLSPIPRMLNQGELNLFYFPTASKDSTWSGTMNMEQHTEANDPDLSYLLVPEKNKLYVIYNSIEGSMDPMASTTTLNMHGEVTDDALIFWNINRTMDFQRSHRFSIDEVSVPYSNNQLPGFAIIRLQH
jgi:hypothetical protein